MRILISHTNYPAQFRRLAPALVDQGHDVVFIAKNREWHAPEPVSGMRVYPPTKHIAKEEVRHYIHICVDLKDVFSKARRCFAFVSSFARKVGFLIGSSIMLGSEMACI